LLSSLPWRRGHRRTRATLGIDWRLFGSAVHHLSTVGDVSRGGVFVRTASPAPAGSPVVLDLETPDGRVELDVHARVAWSSPHGMGLRFTRALRLDTASG
jgi:hypothetical protein